MVVCACIAYVLGVLYARFAATAGQGFGAELRKDEFEKFRIFLLRILIIFQRRL